MSDLQRAKLQGGLVGNAPCSWGIIGPGENGISYGAMLDELAATGYRGTELGRYGFMPTDPALLREELASRGLTLLGAYASLELRDPRAVQKERARLERIARLIAAAEPGPRRPYFVLADADSIDPARHHRAGRITPDLALPSTDWRTLTRNAEEAARIVHDVAGLTAVFHPHCASFVETPAEIERFLNDTDPAWLNLVFDTGHYVYGSGEPDADGLAARRGLERFWTRVRYIHLKDCSANIAAAARREGWDYTRSVKAGLFAELGAGSIQFGAVIDLLRERGYADWVTVEQDVLPGMGSPQESALRNREYLASLGL